MQKLDVSLAERSYPIYIDRGLLGQDLIRGHVRGNQVMVVTNETIAPLYLDAVTRGLGDLQCDTLILPDGEQHKTLATLERIFDALMAHRHSRTTTLVALGGGVIGDMVGFAAACYSAAWTSSRCPPRCWRRWIPRWAARPPSTTRAART